MPNSIDSDLFEDSIGRVGLLRRFERTISDVLNSGENIGCLSTFCNLPFLYKQ